MHYRGAFVCLVVGLTATSVNAAIMARQDTSSSSIATTSNTIAPQTSSAAITSASTTPSPALTSAASTISSALPFVSVESGGSLTTITPSATTSLRLSPTGTGNSTGTNTTISACTADTYANGGTFQPFCLPANGSAWIKNTSYPVTWNPDFWPGYKGNVVLALLYTGADGSNVIYQNDNIANSLGLYNLNVSEDWLNGNEQVAAKLLIAPNEATANAGAHWGPIVTLQVSDTPFDTTPPKWNGKSLAVAIAVPICVVAFIIFLCGICYCTRKHRKFPEGLKLPRNGGKRKGYAEGRSRRKRTMGMEKTGTGVEGDDEFELGTVSGYRDEPAEVYSDVPVEERRH